MFIYSIPLRYYQALTFTRNSFAIFAMLIGMLVAATPARAAIYSYEISNFPSVQNGATLTGNISIDTTGGTEDGTGSGIFFVGTSAITTWNFTVAPLVGASYIGSSSGINPMISGNGGAFDLYATPTSLSVFQATSLSLQSDYLVAGNVVELEWVYDSPIYAASTISGGGATWFNTDRTTLDKTFPSDPDRGAQSWVIATTVPEPGSTALICLGLLFFAVARIRRHRPL